MEKSSNTIGLGSALLSLFTSTTTLICCALPALLVTLGAGAALAGLINSVPQLVLFSEYKSVIFGAAFLMLGINGFLLWRNRNAPCPIDLSLEQAKACERTRSLSNNIYWLSVVLFSIGVWFAFVLPTI